MDQKRLKFAKESEGEFYKTLKRRINSYFEQNDIPRTGNLSMYLKSVVMLLLYFVPYIIIITGTVTEPLGFVALWVLMGVGMSGIGLSIMHDANHGAYSQNRAVNRAMGLTMNAIGCNASTWKLQHNVLHHSYTNIHGADEDIDTSGLMRFSPHQSRKWFHRFQHYYAWFFYGLMTINRITAKDFTQMVRFRKIGLVKNAYRREIMQIVLWKVLYFSYMLVLPLLLLPVSPWLIIVSFVFMHMVNGLILSLVFQSAHVMPTSEFHAPDDSGTMKNNWAVHQMLTTANFSPANKALTWFIGGLNFQIEHHLFSNICHVHYKNLSSIVKTTAEEFGIPYISNRTFISAIADHARFLKKLGMPENS